ncbi:mitochondrial superoxide dismutase [Drechslerella stenobrocha 248]|uniref:Superoxide dismutase n=1 Tax=Drechslerella stenobrocha 248 TaxID=1043628 RepID=W7HWB5_9PEZI|nr:mitochondrial superoxide dismutase [Drechslerella stenobrocha 248]
MGGTYTLPPLPYAYDALEPYISAQIMELHHSKHHATYVANLNKAISSPNAVNTQSLIHFNGGGHINHSIFWKNLAPASSPDVDKSAAPTLMSAINSQFGSFGDFRSRFNAILLGIQGSGWGWLILKDDGNLDIIATRDQDTVPYGTAIFGVDMWEHAYYLQYMNGKAAYTENIWNIINWKYAEARFSGAGENDFTELKAML